MGQNEMSDGVKVKVLEHRGTRKAVVPIAELPLCCDYRKVVILATGHLLQEDCKIV
jgi:hypothetical protein